MKKLLIFILLMLPLISAVEVDMKTEFSQGETLMARVSGNFLEPIQKENIFFYREHVRTPLDYDVAKINDEFYIYAPLKDKLPNNYSLSIENVKYMKGSEITDEDIVREFIITEEKADFSVKPGFIIADEEFTIQVQNLQDFKIEIEINENKTIGDFFESLFKGFKETENSIELKSGEIKYLEFNLGNETSFRIVQLKTENISYEIPVYVFVSYVEDAEEQNQSAELNESEETSSESGEEIIKSATTKTCEELEGVICDSNEECNGTSQYAKDAVCCLGNCEEIEKNNTGKIIGWSMLVIILIALILFFKKKSRTKPKIDLLKIAKGKN